MHTVQRQVTAFHAAGGHLINDSPKLVDAKTIALRKRLISEEARELFEAMTNDDLVAVAHELADLLYVVYGTAISYGIDMQPVSDEVHRANMTKFGTPGEYANTCEETGKSLKDQDCKTLKPATYKKPNIAEIVALQTGF